MEMTNFEKKKFIFLAFLICLIIGCNTEESDWNKIKQSDKISEIELFIKNHPDASHLIDAKNLINLINKKNAFAEVAKTNTIEAYESFFKTYNDSSIQCLEAKKLLSGLLINLNPDAVYVCGHIAYAPEIGVMYGKLEYGIGNNSINFNAPNPTHQKVVFVVISNKGLEKKLVEGKAYLWRGQNEFLFIRDIDSKKNPIELAKEFGIKNL